MSKRRNSANGGLTCLPATYCCSKDPLCGSCPSSPSKCDACIGGFGPFTPEGIPYRPGAYMDPASGRCRLCPHFCDQCTHTKQGPRCESCASGYVKVGGACKQ